MKTRMSQMYIVSKYVLYETLRALNLLKQEAHASVSLKDLFTPAR